MSETRERSALEVLRRLSALVEERHLVVMGPQDLTDPLWDDIEALLATPASDGGEVRERVEEILSEWEDLIGDSVESWGAVLPPSPAEIADRILALLSGSGTPQGEGEAVAYIAEIAGEPVLLWPAGAAVETGNPTLTPLYAAPVPAREGEELIELQASVDEYLWESQNNPQFDAVAALKVLSREVCAARLRGEGGGG